MDTPSHANSSPEYASASGRLTINFSVDFEKERVRQTKLRLPWYHKQGYTVSLPQGDLSSQESITKEIQQEFTPTVYKHEAAEAIKIFEHYEERFFPALQSIFGDKAIPNIKLYLTQYGTGGSYQLPNMVIVNIKLPHHFGTLFHEILHLHLEPYIKHYQITHWIKERTVDLLQRSNAFSFLPPPRNTSWDKVETIVDPLFERYFFHNRDLYFSQLQKNISTS